jgi:hypothetical protein
MIQSCLKYALVMSITSIILVVSEYYLLSHELSWKISTRNILSVAIILICTYAIFYEILKKYQVPHVLWKSFGVSIISVLIAGIILGCFAFIYISQWHPEYTQKMASVEVMQGGPYKTGAESAGTHFGASMMYSAGGMLILSPVLFLIIGIPSGLLVMLIFIFRRYRLTRHSIRL